MKTFKAVIFFCPIFILSCGIGSQNTTSESISCAYNGGANTSNSVLPFQVLDLTNWRLTLPIGTVKNPTIVSRPALDNYLISPYFLSTDDGKGIVFNANSGGVTTTNSNFPRSELREMSNNGQNYASWSAIDGSINTMISTQKITMVPPIKKAVVISQVHDAIHDVIMIELRGNKLSVVGFDYANGSGDVNYGTLDSSYNLCTLMKIKILVSNNIAYVYYNDMNSPKVIANLPSVGTGIYTGTGFFFQAGMYNHSNISYGDAADSYGETVISELTVSHN